MKKLFLLFALFGVLAVGCEELFPTEQSSNTTPIFRIDGEGEYIVGVKGEEIAVMVTTNIDYSVVIPEDAKDWLSVAYTRSETREEILVFVVARNDNFEERRAEVELVDANGEALETLSFVQDGLSKIFETNSEEFYFFEPEGSSVTIDVTTNLEYSVVIDQDVQSWLSVADTRATLREETLTFTATPNDTDKLRYAFVKLVDADKSILQEIPFLQNAITQSDSSCPNDEIWYTNDSTTETTTPYATNDFGANIVSNTYDAEKECWIITFDGKVTTIGYAAFYKCSSLTSVIIPDSVTTIGYAAFYECSSLTSVTIPDSVTTIGEEAFAWCSSLTSVTIPDSVTTIGEGAFCDCSSLTSVTIPDSVTTIGDYAFFNCYNLTNVTIPDSVTTIWPAAFGGCSSLREFNGKYASEDGRCLIVDDTLNSFAPAGLTEYTIPDSVTTIGKYAFYSCSSLTNVTIPDSVATIGEVAFYLCSSLTSVTIPDSVTTIRNAAFTGCSSLREFNGKYASEDGRCLIIDGTLNSFAPAGLTEYTIPNGVTTISRAIFEGCSSLTSVTIPDSVTTIGNEAFAWCSSLTSITIPDSVTTIGAHAFVWCESLTSVTIPDSVTTIGSSAFYSCRSLTSAYCKATTPPAGGDYMFSDNASGRKIYVPMESVNKYKSASYWSSYSDYIEGYNFETGEVTPSNTIPSNEIWYTNDSTTEATTPYKTNVFGANIVSNTYDAAKECWIITFDGKVTTIGYAAFAGCDSLTSVTIPDSITEIGDYAFCDCYSLTSVTIPDSVTEIGYDAFAYCSSLTSVTIPDSVTTIGDYVFYCCSSLTSVTIPDSVTTIGDYAFYDCSSLTSVTIPDSVTKIGDMAFYGCDSLTSGVTIPDSVTAIGDGAFAGCSSLQEFKGKFASKDGRCLIIDGTLNAFAPAGLTEYTIPDSVTTIGNHAFAECYSLTSVTIPDSVTEIGKYAFYNCWSLTSVTIPDSVTEIGYAAFAYCSSLTSVTIPDSVTTIGIQAFLGCSILTSVTIPDSVTTIGLSAFSGCNSLQEFKGKFAFDNGRCLIVDGTLNSFAPAGLSEYTIPNSVTTIGVWAFNGCSSLTSVTIPDSVTTIENHAFYYCTSLTSVTIPDSVTTIGFGAFYYCTSLTSVYCKAVTPPTGDSWMFDDNASNRIIYVPTESIEAYKSASYWSDYADAIVGYDF